MADEEKPLKGEGGEGEGEEGGEGGPPKKTGCDACCDAFEKCILATARVRLIGFTHSLDDLVGSHLHLRDHQ